MCAVKLVHRYTGDITTLQRCPFGIRFAELHNAVQSTRSSHNVAWQSGSVRHGDDVHSIKHHAEPRLFHLIKGRHWMVADDEELSDAKARWAIVTLDSPAGERRCMRFYVVDPGDPIGL